MWGKVKDSVQIGQEPYNSEFYSPPNCQNLQLPVPMLLGEAPTRRQTAKAAKSNESVNIRPWGFVRNGRQYIYMAGFRNYEDGTPLDLNKLEHREFFAHQAAEYAINAQVNDIIIGANVDVRATYRQSKYDQQHKIMLQPDSYGFYIPDSRTTYQSAQEAYHRVLDARLHGWKTMNDLAADVDGMQIERYEYVFNTVLAQLNEPFNQ